LACVAVASFVLLVSDEASAQAGSASAPTAAPARAGHGPGYGAGWQARHGGEAASAPRGAGAGWGHAKPHAGGRGQAGAEHTPGWSLMTPPERDQHRAAMARAQTHEACSAVMAQHRQQVAERAQAKGVTVPTPRRDACAALKS
jgi:hypothetical protein